MNLMALICLARASPCPWEMGTCPWALSFSRVEASLRRSDLVPTRMRGTVGQKWVISGYHLEVTFSKDTGFTTEKQAKKTCALAYERGRRRSYSSYNTIG